ncbi:MAG: tetratricopeptide repeat protein [Deltaproteobacteria bacterium]|nr:tetratricopeptide repeat protein [Deltaproteobacteria bacterium]
MSEARVLYREGFRHFVEQRFDDAVRAYREALALDSELAIAWNGLSMALKAKGDLDGAIDAGRKLVALEPDEPLGHTSLSIFYQAKGMIAEAEREKAIAMQLGMKQKSAATP